LNDLNLLYQPMIFVMQYSYWMHLHGHKFSNKTYCSNVSVSPTNIAYRELAEVFWLPGSKLWYPGFRWQVLYLSLKYFNFSYACIKCMSTVLIIYNINEFGCILLALTLNTLAKLALLTRKSYGLPYRSQFVTDKGLIQYLGESLNPTLKQP